MTAWLRLLASKWPPRLAIAAASAPATASMTALGTGVPRRAVERDGPVGQPGEVGADVGDRSQG